MLVPLNGTVVAAQSVQPALDLAAAGDLEVIVVHVFGEDRIPRFTDQPQHETTAFAHEFVARYAPGIPTQLELRVGIPADEVLDAAVALRADLLALSWSQGLEHGRAQVVKRLLADSPIPLLLLPLVVAPSSTRTRSSGRSQ
jgi:nucleotide-binding universal stress UspA family protein